jgi:tetratricopeptide (TPR) repeat protein
MLRKILLILILLSTVTISYAQTADEVYDRYLDFNLARLQGEEDKATDLAEQLMKDTLKLKPNVRINFYNSAAKLYEDGSQSVKAIELYERVIAAQPQYYVAHRALGYLYLKNIPDADKLLNSPSTDPNYIKAVKKSLPQLEKAQACDPDDSTLALIKTLYANIGDKAGLASLESRLKTLKKDCIDILSD